MTTTTVLANVLVKDWTVAQEFYAGVLDRGPDLVPMPGCAEWHVPGGGVLQVVENAERAGSSSVALVVDDLDATLARLRSSGVTVGTPMTVPDAFRVVTFADPEGTMVTLVETFGAPTVVVRSLFAAYLAQDREAAAALLADDFVFTSPQDEPIDRDEWLRRCFPTADRVRSQDLVDVVEVAPGQVFVRYVYDLTTGARHRNTEVITVRDGRVAEVQVYFGAPVPA
ncbi:DUF4440 domain-containing protein [Actinomycetospora termitidis]|uniref:DUF4440 domain-containing protein n=1 Tax=Actinomycetospora termitidis TaxID=3053470 RepID=A0ABT7MH45_9PSEU|nr:DUF4440 domain-containing protein [Actinomycetospora sp. Odt1-22]MDL5159494.1 DUF4440 domain-containing protein [Actinomycetospora sp. Odt1-22]